MLRKLGLKTTLLGFVMGTLVFGGNVAEASSDDSFKEYMLSEPSNGISARGIGTLVSMGTDTNLINGNVHSDGGTYCSKMCKEIRVASYIYKNNKSVSYKLDRRSNAYHAYAIPDYVKYYTGSSYYGASDHYALDNYGQSVADRTIDSDL
ncbi:hypothetical protein [Virgibacillus sp. 6R]|uniref:hypothetical protein n=1 Tax=Metabacillus sp. 22489 TaxID=3453928 RepID=UPI00119CEF01